MGENKSVIELKKKALKEEVNSENPDKKVIKRLKKSIERHKEVARYIKYRRQKSKRDKRR